MSTSRSGPGFAAAVLCVLACGTAAAAAIDVGNPDVEVRWDNTLRLNLAVRVDERDDRIANTAIADEGTWRFDQGDFVTQRLDVLSEFDLVYASALGLRVSGAGWYDHAYDEHSRSNPDPPLSGIPSYPNGVYSDYTQKRYVGPAAEWLDAFAFAKFSPGDVPVAVKAGRHTLYWGESLLLGGALHSVAYAQSPLDLQKGFATPGAEAKELFRPLANVSAQAQVADTLSLAGQYFLEWESSRYPEGGTYLGPVDFLFDGPDRQFLSAGLGFAARGDPVEPDDGGAYGLAARWSPRGLDGTLGFYHRHFADKLPQVLLTQVGAGTSRYNLIYADGIDLYGLSLSRQLFGASLGAEISYRHDTPLNAQVLGNASTSGLPQEGETPGPRGDTFHGLANLFGTLGSNWLSDAGTWTAEMTWNTYSRVRGGAALFNAEGHAPCAGRDKWDGCATKQYAGLGMNVTPLWFQVIPDVDLLAPVSVSSGLYGNSAVVLGGNQAAGNYSVGVAADVHQAYRIELRYVDYFGRTRDNGTAVTSQNGLVSLLKDRGFAALTIKATF